MGEVYRARDTRLGREVALKVIPDRLRSDPEALARFQREARAASALNHPHIVAIHDIGRERAGNADIFYYTMELIDGATLGERIGRDPLPRILNYFVQIAEGLAKAHGAGILHRDLKPENVMVSVDGYAKIVDFGLAKVQPAATEDTRSPTAVAGSAAGSVVGTVSYMSPEQVEGRPIDARSDIFSFGSMLYVALTGKRPFDSRTPVDTMHAIAHYAPAPLAESGRAIPADLQRVVARCLAKAPEDRYQSIKEAAIELRSVIRDIESGATQPIVKRRWPRLALIAASAAMVLAIVAAVIGTQPWRARPATSIQSLAVLPFENAARNPDADYLSDGITDDIINSLSQLPNIRVMSRSTVFRYRKKEDDPRAIGKDLGVDALVLGELRQLHDVVNVKVELVRTADGIQLWGQQYSRKAADLLNVQDDIARDVTEHLQVRISGDAMKRMSRAHTQNPKAYEAYLKGRYFWNLRPQGLDKALAYFEEARRIDPGDALAHAGVAMAYDMMGAWETGRLPPNVAFPKAKASAEQALAVDPQLPEAYAALGFEQLHYERDFAASEHSLQRALILKPSDANTHHWYSHYFIARGRPQESLRESQKALELDPLDAPVVSHLAWHYIYTRQPDRALEQCTNTLALYPTSYFAFYFRGLAYEQKGMLVDAIAAFRRAHELVPKATFGTAALGHALALAGSKAEAKSLLRELETDPTYVSPFDRAILNLGLGNRDKALDELNRAINESSAWCVYFRAEPRLDPLRQDPRFIALMRRLPV
jgi:serine/threonine protein kinase/tetratricopeptide (TPR) repeat protein